MVSGRPLAKGQARWCNRDMSSQDTPSDRATKGRGKTTTRRVAAGMLAQILRGKTLDDVRDRLDDLPPGERNLADAIVQTALRHYGEITTLLARHMKRPLPLRPHIAHALLVSGVAQLRFMDIADHAALNETVAATGRREQPFRGLINAVLRAVAKDDTPTDPHDNLPDWMKARFLAAYGAEDLAIMVKAHQANPPLDIAFKNSEKAAGWRNNADLEAGLEPGLETEPIKLSDTHLRLVRPGNVTALPGFHEGDWFVQDIAASYAAAWLDKLLPTGAQVLDVCAAPGGKTMQLAGAGHHVTALDISATRLSRLQANLHRTQLTAQLVEADALDWQNDTMFDAVLLDAPCSASGTLRRHPDLVLHRREGYVAKLVAAQTALLARAAHHVKSGGYLCYAVCSLDPAEGEDVVARFATNNADFTLITPSEGSTELPNMLPPEIISPQGLRCTPAIWADRGGMDGFFIAVFKKTGD